jgi:hypothetical protein
MNLVACLLGIVALAVSAAAQGGAMVEVKDLRYFSQQQKVIFPNAEVKLVTFEFEAAGGDERGKQRAKELHDEFLAKIHDLHGGAIVTFITPPGQRIENYRVVAQDVAKQQKAQMVLWGRVLVDPGGTALINARLELIDPPPGISADYQRETAGRRSERVGVVGVIDAPVTQLRVVFNTLEKDVTPVAYFLSGLARYYKGAVREGSVSIRWLKSSVDDFSRYVALVPEKSDQAALSQAHLYLARGHVRLAAAEPARASQWLAAARQHAQQAARLNPYDASVPTAQAVIAARLGSRPDEIGAYLQQAVALAPADTNARLNLAVSDSAQGNVKDAVRQLDSATVIFKAQDREVSPAVQNLRRQIETYQGVPR